MGDLRRLVEVFAYGREEERVEGCALGSLDGAQFVAGHHAGHVVPLVRVGVGDARSGERFS
nr:MULTISPECIES: hypothetical protein [Streptomyces]WTB09940.1 hypothetical protein OG546_40830 [Streptomyces antimycoticus]